MQPDNATAGAAANHGGRRARGRRHGRRRRRGSGHRLSRRIAEYMRSGYRVPSYKSEAALAEEAEMARFG